VKARTTGTNIGFGSKLKDDEKSGHFKDVKADDLMKFGMIPEFIGRFPTTINVEELSKHELIKVLTTVKNNFIDQYTYLFSIDDIDLSFTDDAIEEIVINCMNQKTGARGLQTEIERVLRPHMFNSGKYKKKGITELNIDKELIINPQPIK
jgi:ATP-dependent Clp protease ATP-binding subunit ClpX